MYSSSNARKLRLVCDSEEFKLTNPALYAEQIICYEVVCVIHPCLFSRTDHPSESDQRFEDRRDDMKGLFGKRSLPW